jgi:uncharacterized protein YbaR (Trm112 family)
VKHSLLGILACPVCKGSLELEVVEESGEEIIAGSLRCPRCDFSYPVTDGIPNLLPPEKD